MFTHAGKKHHDMIKPGWFISSYNSPNRLGCKSNMSSFSFLKPVFNSRAVDLVFWRQGER